MKSNKYKKRIKIKLFKYKYYKKIINNRSII